MSFLFRYLRFHDIIGGIHVPVDDGVDKLNRKYTLLVFLFLALPIFTKQYIGDPIECFAPVYFAEHQSRYINSYCWTQSTYYMVPVGDPEDDGDQQEPPDRITPDEVDYFIGFETVTHIGNERLRRVRVSYYQWAPLILLVQGLCFYIPFLIWNSCANNAGVKLRRLLKKASDIASLPPGCQQREALLAEFVDQFHTLVTGEAGWCADLQCQPSGPDSALASPASSSANSQASGLSAGPPPPMSGGRGSGGPRGNHAPQGGASAGDGSATGNSQARGGPDHRDHSRSGESGARAGNRGASDRGPGENNISNNNNNNNNNSSSNQQQHHHHSSGKTGCCLVSIPIIGSLLACCLKPCTTFGLVGPSKYLCLLYLAVKSAYVFNVGLQFFLLGQFLGRGYLKHGLELINRLVVNGDWWASPRFPLSTLCQVRADMSGGLRSYTCQCVLPINVFNEKIFSVVWFYMAFLMPLNVLSLFFWIYRTFEANRLSYIRLCLWRTRLVELNQIHRTVRRLSQSYLGWDGVFLLRLVEHNHGSIMATLIMSRLWEFYANQMKLQEDQNQLVLANNAQHTLLNTTTAISNQHQLLAAAAAAAAAVNSSNNNSHQNSSAGGGNHHHHGPPPPALGGGGVLPHVGGTHHGAHQHSHPPLMPTQQQQQQQHFSAGAGGPLHSHPHPHSHAHPPYVGAAQQQGGVGHPMGGPQGMLAHAGNPAHHSGQISQQSGHHPLHAANTHAIHPGHHHPQLGGHLSGPFAGPTNASIIAQLQHQQHQHAAVVAAAAQQQLVQQATGSSSTTNPNQQSAPGNVAAAVAALAAAAAANSTSTSASSTATHIIPAALTSGGGNTSASASSNPISQVLTGGAQVAPSGAQHQSGAGAGVNSSSSQRTNTHLQPLLQPISGPSDEPPAGSTTGCSSLGGAGGSLAAPGSQQATSSISQQQQQQLSATASVVTNPTSTTSFINPANQPPGSGPPLPPPPPAHVMASVAATTSGLARTGPPSAGNNSALQKQQQQHSGAVGISSNIIGTSGSSNNSALLFNLKSSNIQAAAAVATSGTRYPPHTLKRA